MLKRVLQATVVLAFVSGPALASHCPVDVGKIDEALAGDHGLSDSQLAKVKDLRDKGEQLHNDGKHDKALENLHEAMSILDIEH